MPWVGICGGSETAGRRVVCAFAVCKETGAAGIAPSAVIEKNRKNSRADSIARISLLFIIEEKTCFWV